MVPYDRSSPHAVCLHALEALPEHRLTSCQSTDEAEGGSGSADDAATSADDDGTDGGSPNGCDAAPQRVGLLSNRRYGHAVVPMDEVADAHRAVAKGGVRGRYVLKP